MHLLAFSINPDLGYKDKRGKYLYIEKLLKIASPASPASLLAQGKGLSDDATGDANDATGNLASPLPTDQDGGDARDDAGDARQNLASPLEPSLHKDNDAGDADDAKNSPSSSKGDQPSLLPDDQDVPKPTNHYQLEDGDQDEF